MNTRKAASKYGVTHQTISDWIRKGWLPATKLATGQWNIPDNISIVTIRQNQRAQTHSVESGQ